MFFFNSMDVHGFYPRMNGYLGLAKSSFICIRMVLYKACLRLHWVKGYGTRFPAASFAVLHDCFYWYVETFVDISCTLLRFFSVESVTGVQAIWIYTEWMGDGRECSGYHVTMRSQWSGCMDQMIGYWSECFSVNWGGPEFLQGFLMPGSPITFMEGKTIFRVGTIEGYHYFITGYLGDNRGSCYR